MSKASYERSRFIRLSVGIGFLISALRHLFIRL
jgi:hypothetical protein